SWGWHWAPPLICWISERSSLEEGSPRPESSFWSRLDNRFRIMSCRTTAMTSRSFAKPSVTRPVCSGRLISSSSSWIRRPWQPTSAPACPLCRFAKCLRHLTNPLLVPLVFLLRNGAGSSCHSLLAVERLDDSCGGSGHGSAANAAASRRYLGCGHDRASRGRPRAPGRYTSGGPCSGSASAYALGRWWARRDRSIFRDRFAHHPVR